MRLEETFIDRKIHRLIELKKQGFTWWQLVIRFFQYMRIQLVRRCSSAIIKIEIDKFEKIHRMNNDFPAEGTQHIAIIETGVLGDCILVVHAFQKLAAWCEKNGYTLDIICSKVMAKIFSDNASIVNANYICFTDRNHISYREYIQLSKVIGKKYYRYVLMRDSNPAAFRLVSLFNKQDAFYYSYDANRNSKINAAFAQKYFTEIMNIENIYFIPQIWKLLLKRIGITDYVTALGHIRALEKVSISNKPYIVISPEASTTDRNLTKEQCVFLVNFLRKKYPQYNIVVSSNANDKQYTLFLRELIRQHGLIDCIGNTTMQQYISVIAGAKLVIGCDSGTIHLSAALGIQSICYKGYWDRPYFLPYQYDVKDNDDRYPHVLYARKKPLCAYCGTRSVSKHLKEYIECQHLRNQQRPFYCLANIDIKDIETAIVQCLD